MEDKITALVIGDPHFKRNQYDIGAKFIARVVEIAKEKSPTFIVNLGDTLQWKTLCYRPELELAELFTSELTKIAPFYLLIGNHDYDNNQQFLTHRHWFTSFKRWENAPIVVDKPVLHEYGGYSFVFCPYVPKGRFTEALNTLIEEGEMWDLTDCIFAHQEFRGSSEDSFVSIDGDEWGEEYPPVISGHIHQSQTIGNVYYTGTPVQHTFKEKDDKRIWLVTFGAEESPYFEIEKIDLGLRKKKELHCNVEDAKNFDFEMLEEYDVKIKLEGSDEEFKAFRKSKVYSSLCAGGVKIQFDVSESLTGGEKRTRKQLSFSKVLAEIVKTKTQPVQEMYVELLGGKELEPSESSDEDDSSSKVCYELVFEESSEESADSEKPSDSSS